jgi:hypothetical protein
VRQGRGSAWACHAAEGEGERGWHGVGMAPSGAIRGGSGRSWRRRAGEQGRATRRDRRGVGAADRWRRATTWPNGQRQGAGEKSWAAMGC